MEEHSTGLIPSWVKPGSAFHKARIPAFGSAHLIHPRPVPAKIKPAAAGREVWYSILQAARQHWCETSSLSVVGYLQFIQPLDEIIELPCCL